MTTPDSNDETCRAEIWPPSYSTWGACGSRFRPDGTCWRYRHPRPVSDEPSFAEYAAQPLPTELCGPDAYVIGSARTGDEETWNGRSSPECTSRCGTRGTSRIVHDHAIGDDVARERMAAAIKAAALGAGIDDIYSPGLWLVVADAALSALNEDCAR